MATEFSWDPNPLSNLDSSKLINKHKILANGSLTSALDKTLAIIIDFIIAQSSISLSNLQFNVLFYTIWAE